MNKWIGILSGLLAGQLILAVTLHLSGPEHGAFEPRDKLLRFERQAVDTLRIEDGNKELTLRKREGQWQLPDSGDFPANPGAVDRLLDRLATLEKGLAVATTPSAAKRFRVDEGAFERKITLLAKEQPQAVLYVGSSPGFRKVHARPEGEAEVYAVALDTWEVGTKADDWIDKSILKLDEAEVTGLELPGLALQRDGEILRVAGLNAGEETNSGEARALLGRVADLRITSVLGVEHDEGQDEAMLELKVTRKGGEVLTYRFHKPKEGAYYLLKRSDLAPYFKLAEPSVQPLLEAKRDKLLRPRVQEPAENTPDSAPTTVPAVDAERRPQ